jgi:hypothetical protein
LRERREKYIWELIRESLFASYTLFLVVFHIDKKEKKKTYEKKKRKVIEVIVNNFNDPKRFIRD